MNDERRQKRSGLRLWHVVLGILGLLIVLIVLWIVAQSGSVKRQIAALRAQGYPTSFEELAEQNRLPAGAKNAADVYVQAFGAFRSPVDDANTPYVGKAELPPRGQPLPATMVSAIERLLADNEGCLELLREARAIEHCRYGWDYAANTPHATSMRHCVQLLAAAMVLSGDRGDTEAVLDYFRDGLRLAESCQNEPGTIGYLLGIAGSALSMRALERTLSVTTYTDGQLSEITRALSEAAETVDLTQALINERCVMIETFEGASPADGSPPAVPRIPILGRLGLPDTLDYMARLIETSELPPHERLERIQEIDDEIEDLSVLHVVVKMSMPGVNRMAKLDVRFRLDLELADCGLAIERYRLATGHVPEDLATLVPDYLDRVPIDPFDGQPIRYLRDGQSYRLYSVFEDGRDQGGQTRDDVNRGDPYDWAFIVVK